jgi:hydrogenase maturation protease
MKSPTKPAEAIVAGFGSPHGDDQVGWRVAMLLQCRRELPLRAIMVREATELAEELEAGCRKLVVVDGCRSGNDVGTVTRLRWPDMRIADRHAHSTHGAGVCSALQLAERLGRLPPDVQVIGIEVGDCRPGAAMSYRVEEAMLAAEAMIVDEVCAAAEH